jgi:hypothetical protein
MYFSQNQVCGDQRMFGCNQCAKNPIRFLMILVARAEKGYSSTAVHKNVMDPCGVSDEAAFFWQQKSPGDSVQTVLKKMVQGSTFGIQG